MNIDTLNNLLKDNYNKKILVIGINNNKDIINHLITKNIKPIILVNKEVVTDEYSKYVLNMDIKKNLFEYIDSSKSEYIIVGNIDGKDMYTFIEELVDTFMLDCYIVKN